MNVSLEKYTASGFILHIEGRQVPLDIGELKVLRAFLEAKGF
jgi:hypothetical protein